MDTVIFNRGRNPMEKLESVLTNCDGGQSKNKISLKNRVDAIRT